MGDTKNTVKEQDFQVIDEITFAANKRTPRLYSLI